MFIKKLSIQNYRIFDSFELDNINIPNGEEGSGITVFVGENGCGKTSLLEALVLPILSYKAENFSINDFNSPNKETFIEVFAEKEFNVAYTMPNGTFPVIGFSFEANLRKREVKAYLSSTVVSDQKYIRSLGSDKPKDGSPDLRVGVNNPFKGPRFNENDILFLDKNRTFQTRSGTYNSTRFDRLMEDFDHQYIKNYKDKSIKDINGILERKLKKNINSQSLGKAINKFKDITNINLSLNLFDNWRPFSKSFFAERHDNSLQINLNMLGSGYEMIFSLLYSFYLSQQSEKQLIIFIDEPELHLHPKLQKDFIDILLDISKNVQIFISSHSPLLIKQLASTEKVKMFIMHVLDSIPKIKPIDERILPWLSANEINYLAFDLATEEYHNELYGHLQDLLNKTINKSIDNHLFEKNKNYKRLIWKKLKKNRETEELTVTIHTYIRHYYHHPENDKNDPYTNELLQQSIETLRNEIVKLPKTEDEAE